MTAQLRLDLIPEAATLDETLVQWMPFALKHDGPAQIERYFVVQSAPLNAQAQPLAPSEAQITTASLGVESSQASASEISSQSMTPGASSDGASTFTPATSVSSVEATKTAVPAKQGCHYHQASFRGRLMCALDLDLPSGYTGVVLQAQGTSLHSAQSSGAKHQGPRTPQRAPKRAKLEGVVPGLRRSPRKQRFALSPDSSQADEDEERDGPDTAQTLEQEVAQLWQAKTASLSREPAVEPPLVQDLETTKTLQAVGGFQSIRVWHPDILPTLGSEGHSRAVHEWVELAHLIHG
ncbi:uncharacterized protein L969DRAFT_90289 [Mixia osmundae IAM 14324]|uniref:Uncharacterized protein n=1 Tax=Mixia osmundae (strain CBS 9802 / IAM 14324 / JCM 22182 / KY 12970) TaxID=764103 RepID=G7DSZ6_MIXOS|nr:uncharacterized protein L969DRAFT_90289 [Mixia osmundae IAM 14324]KEI37217.1 hypothetical protein L969DRAFT_90289 [Mixia osmundae IAM 14324]GAA93706.1 hypothetical protein E5Q_00351 [Mixia osmundae IAM 14324]